MLGFNKKQKDEKEPILEEQIEEQKLDLTGIEIADDSNEIDLDKEKFTQQEVEKEVNKEQLPHPAIINYNYQIELENRILGLEIQLKEVIGYLKDKEKEQEVKKEE